MSKNNDKNLYAVTFIIIVLGIITSVIGLLYTIGGKIEVYTTQITYVLDMGIIAPVAWICLFQLRNRNGMGYILI